MRKSTSLVLAAGVIAASGIPTVVSAQSKATPATGIAEREGLFIDGRSFSVVSGTTQGELSALINKLDARSLGPGAIIFRMGNQLYIAEAPGAVESASARYGGSRNDYGSDRYGGSKNDYGSDRYGSDRYGGSRNDYGSDRYGGSKNDYGSDRYGSDRYGSDRYGGSRNDYGSDRYGGSKNDYGSDRYGGSKNDYGSDRYGGSRNDYGSDRVYINDPDYVEFRLKKAFEENWSSPVNK